MEFAESGVVRGVKYGDYLSLISKLVNISQLTLDIKSHKRYGGGKTVHYTSRDGNVKLGIGRSFKDDRLFYWVFAPEESLVLEISDFITSSFNTALRRN